MAFAEDCIGPLAEDAVRALKPGEVLLLENLRFHKEEEKNDAAFIDKLSVLGDVYVNDAFSAAHRAHASTEGLANRLPAAAGRLMQAELEALDKALGNPKRPVCAVVGGAKVSTKLDLLGNLVGRVDKLIIGGGMANTFLHAQGIKVGKSLCEKDLAPTALEILAKAKAAKCKVLLPVDVVVAGEFKANAPHQVVDATACPDDQMILDIGPKSIALYAEELAECATLVWNGPLGAFEMKPFDAGTVALAADRGASSPAASKLLSVAGGGDTVGGAGRGGRRGEILLRLDGRRRLPGMDGRQDPARRCGPDTGGVRPRAMSTPPPCLIVRGCRGIRRIISRSAFPTATTASGWSARAASSSTTRIPRSSPARSAPGAIKILLAKRAIEPRKGFWTVPAGYMELGETTEQAARTRGARRSLRHASRSTACSPCTAWRASARCRSCIARGC